MAHSIFRRLLVPHDLSKPADKALRLAAELAEEHAGDVLVLHVVAPFYPFADLPYGAQVSLDVGEIARSAKDQLEARVAKVLRGSVVPVTCRVRIGEAFQQIMDAASGRSAIVMSTAGHTGLTRLVIGSITEKVVRHSTMPVLTLHPTAKTARRALSKGKSKAGSKRKS
jgi:nucleotide-binding universal stress UspA family protein